MTKNISLTVCFTELIKASCLIIYKLPRSNKHFLLFVHLKAAKPALNKHISRFCHWRVIRKKLLRAVEGVQLLIERQNILTSTRLWLWTHVDKRQEVCTSGEVRKRDLNSLKP